jgi:hypothetical protein
LEVSADSIIFIIDNLSNQISLQFISKQKKFLDRINKKVIGKMKESPFSFEVSIFDNDCFVKSRVPPTMI